MCPIYNLSSFQLYYTCEFLLVISGPAQWMGLWRHVSTTFWKFSAISKIVRHMFVGQTVQKLHPIHIFASLGLYFALVNSKMSIRNKNIAVSTIFDNVLPGL